MIAPLGRALRGAEIDDLERYQTPEGQARLERFRTENAK